jgi:hypothetical protein
VEEKNYRRPAIIGVIVGAVLALATAAIAAAVVTLTAETIGEGIANVSPCDSAYDVAADTPTWDDTAGSYVVSGVTVSNLNAPCIGDAVKVNVLNSSGVSISSATATITATSVSVPLTSTVSVGDIGSFASVIYTP